MRVAFPSPAAPSAFALGALAQRACLWNGACPPKAQQRVDLGGPKTSEVRAPNSGSVDSGSPVPAPCGDLRRHLVSATPRQIHCPQPEGAHPSRLSLGRGVSLLVGRRGPGAGASAPNSGEPRLPTAGQHALAQQGARMDDARMRLARPTAPRRALGIYDRRTYLQSLMGLEWAMFA